MKYLFPFFIVLLACAEVDPPQGFAYIKKEIPTIEIEARYFSENNFMGRKIDGYKSNQLMLSHEAVNALKLIQHKLKPQNLGLKIFDAYRPQKAVDHFVAWAKNPADTLNKQMYYPNIKKSSLIANGYIAAKSGHSKGSTVDLTLVNLTTKEELDMGTPWDYFGPESGGSYQGLLPEQIKNRQFLKSVMEENGFKVLPEEWWHFSLIKEPFPDTYFNFNVE